MRKTKKDPLNKSTKPSNSSSLEDAIRGRQANLLGQNGDLHAQDRFLAVAQKGDMVIFPDQLSEAQLEFLNNKLGNVSDQLIGMGNTEISLSKHIENGISIAEQHNLDELIRLSTDYFEFSLQETCSFQKAHIRTQIMVFFERPASNKIFTYLHDGKIQGVLFGKIITDRKQNLKQATIAAFYISERHRNSNIVFKLSQAFKVWARSHFAHII